MTEARIDVNKCVRCGVCADVCPTGIITKDGAPALIREREESCISCGHCVAVCPKGAFSVGDIIADECPEFSKESIPDSHTIETLVRSRRSIRTYRDEQIPRKTLTRLIDTAQYSPTAGNSRLIRWMVVDDTDTIHRLAGMTVDYLRDFVNREKSEMKYIFQSFVDEWEKGNDVIFRGAPSIVLAHAPASYGFSTVDSSIALSSLDIMAPSFGLGTCWAGVFMSAFAKWEPLRKEVDLPAGSFCYGAMMIGIPKHTYRRIPSRKSTVIEWR